MFGKYIENLAQEHAKKCFPFESVGAVVRTDNGAKQGNAFEYVELENVAKNKENNFLVDSKEILPIMPKIAGVIHSHTAHEKDKVIRLFPSQADMETQLAFNVPFGITYTDKEIASDILWFGDSVPKADLVGRFFIHGVQDCYSLIRDYYQLKLGIHLKEFPRSWEWWRNGQDLYKQGFEQTGFRQISLSEVKAGDVLLMAVTPDTAREQNPCHGAVYLGDEMILHHLSGSLPYDKGRLSCTAQLQRYKNLITHVLRHEDIDNAHD